MTQQSCTHYTRYNTVHANSRAGRMIDAIPEDDGQLKEHSSMTSQKHLLLDLLAKLRSENPEGYSREIYGKILQPGSIRSNYISAAHYTAHTPVDNRTRYALQLILLRYIIMYGRDYKRFTLGEFSYSLHDRAFRQAGNTATIGLLPWAFLESFDVTAANMNGLPFGDWMINTAIEQLNPPNGKISYTGLQIRQYIDYTSQLWRPVIKEGWDFFVNC